MRTEDIAARFAPVNKPYAPIWENNVRTYYHRRLLAAAVDAQNPDVRRLLGLMARMRPGQLVDGPALAHRLGLDVTFVEFLLDSLAEAGLLDPLPPAAISDINRMMGAAA